MDENRSYSVLAEKFDGRPIELTKALERLEETKKEIDEKIIDFDELREESNKTAKYYKQTTKQLRKSRIKSIVNLAATILISVSALKGTGYLVNMLPIMVKNEVYQEGMEPKLMYDEIKESEYEENKNCKTIIVYEPFDETGSRTIRTYDVSDINFESVKEAFEYNLDDLEYTSYIEMKSKNNFIDNEETFREYVIRKKTLYFDSAFGVANTARWFIFVIVCSRVLYKMFNKYNDYIIRFAEINYLLDKKISSKDELKETIEKLNKCILELLSAVEKNEEYKKRFMELFNELSPILNDPSNLYERFTESYDEVQNQMILKKINTER